MKTLITTIALLIAVCFPTQRATARPVQVMLSFDTERNGDVEALRTLDLGVPATYFITGKFAEENREFVAGLARGGNTIGSHSYSHPHLTGLSREELESEMRKAKQTLESITGTPVVWFRAPYMEYNDEVMQSLKKMGFMYDSSDQDRWQRQDVLYEVPVSSFMSGTMIASDYDLLYKHEATAAQFEG
jgi:peptidoglycan/xylan/chitin deacetylase (PgdA/CDA1 family)